MNILICPDSFKESLPAGQVASHIEKGVMRAMPEAICKLLPLSDGGDGMMEAVLSSTGGQKLEVDVCDPLMRTTKASFGILEDKETAVIEMAAASGLKLLSPEERDVMAASSYGTGELIRAALDRGCKTIVLGIGGSATVDAGTGMAQALGAEFLDKQKRSVKPGGGSLGNITSIDLANLDRRLERTTITVCCDVTNPLTGKTGAAFVYGPQKGASPRMVTELDTHLRHVARIIREQLGKDVGDMPGSGAAGGMGAGLVAFLKARLEPGFDFIARLVGLEKWIKWADLILTGEGRMDDQTHFGKTPAGVAQKAVQNNKPLIAFTGWLGTGHLSPVDQESTILMPIADMPMTVEQSMDRTGELLENAAERAMRLIKLGKG
jgi:glycerate kinase